MKIIVDADACPVKELIEQHARFPITWVASTAHNLGERENVVTVDSSPEAADYRIVSLVNAGDIVITQDYGLASLVLAKSARALSPRGLVYSRDNIDSLLAQRYLAGKARRQGIRTRGPRARSDADDQAFLTAFARIQAEAALADGATPAGEEPGERET